MEHANMLIHSVKPVIKPLPFICLYDDPVTKYLITALNEFHTEDAKALPDSNNEAMYMYTLQKHVTKHQIQH